MSTSNVHPQVRAIVALLCEGFNVPSSETKIRAFADKLKHPHVEALKEAYDIFTDGRASSDKMPTIAEFMRVYKDIKNRHENRSNRIYIEDRNVRVNHDRNKQMYNKLITMVQKGGKRDTSLNLCQMDHTGCTEHGIQYTITTDKLGREYVHFHNHPINSK